VKLFLQILAFFFPSPINLWLYKLASAKIGKDVIIHPGVMIISRKVKIDSSVKIRFGTMINVRSFTVGEKSLIGYFVHIKGMSDLKIGAACVIGPQTMINCDCPITLGYYSGIGPRCTLFTHGSFLPVSEGYRTTFGPIELKNKAWVTMNSTVGPGVTVGEGTNVMPGTVLLESVGSYRLVAGNTVKLMNIPLFRTDRKAKLVQLAAEILERYCQWADEFDHASASLSDGVLRIRYRRKELSISVNGTSDVVLLTREGERREGMFFNLADLTTDTRRNSAKMKFEAFMRLYYGMTFLSGTVEQ
jgi:acetyltransferase-like isoleucine patch superfamily enzyme